jgi:hypothetical protein
MWSRFEEACRRWKDASTQRKTLPREAKAELTPARAALRAASSDNGAGGRAGNAVWDRLMERLLAGLLCRGHASTGQEA